MNAPTLSNPFPSDTVVKNSIEQLPDFRETNSYHRAISIVENFRENFPIVGSVGMAMGIRGRFGSGKTHLVFQLIQELQSSTSLQSVPMYAKPDKADFLNLYVTHFAGRLSAETLKKAVSLHFAKLLRLNTAPQTETADGSSMVTLGSLMEGSESEKSLTEIAREEVDRLLATDPAKIIDLVEQDLLPISGLNRDFAIELETTERIAGEDSQTAGTSTAVTDVSRDFFRAYSKVTDKDLGPIALRWIQGAELTNAERQDLGLETARISQASAAKQALRFLLGAFKKADFAVMFCLDEFERISSRGTIDDLNASAGLLKDLAETFQQTGHLLVISGMDDAWNQIPKDVFARIKPAEIVEMALSEPEAKGLIDTYCRSSNLSTESVFESSAIDLLYEASDHNTRRILDLAHESYEIATDPNKNKTEAPSELPIKEAHVEQAANTLLSDNKRRAAVDQVIQTVAQDLRLPLFKDFNRGSLRCDYLLGDPDRPQVVVAVTKSIFKIGEVSAARELATLSQSVHKNFPQACFCVVIIGYSTKEVRDELARVVDRVFSFDEESFSLEFREFLKTLSSKPREVEQRLVSQEAAYRELLQKFDALERSRYAEIEQLKRALESLQSESVQVRETAYEKRVTDKMGETLDKLSKGLNSEEELAFRSASKEGRNRDISQHEKLERASRLIDEQRAYLRRAEILNERRPQAAEFAEELKRLEYLTEKAGELWHSEFRYPSPAQHFFDDTLKARDMRDLYRARKDTLSALEGLHFRRAEIEGAFFSKLWQGIRTNKMLLALSFLCLVSTITLLYSLYSGWTNEKAASAYYSAQVSLIQGQVRIIELDPSVATTRGDSSAQSLLQYMVYLETAPGGRTYVVSNIVADKSPELRKQLLALRDTLLQIYDAARKGQPLAGSNLQNQLASVDTLCTEFQQQVNGISFSTFAGKYMNSNLFWFMSLLLPIFLLPYYLASRGYQHRLIARRRMD